MIIKRTSNTNILTLKITIFWELKKKFYMYITVTKILEINNHNINYTDNESLSVLKLKRSQVMQLAYFHATQINNTHAN